MTKQSAGILLYRKAGEGIEVFVAHPGGPFFAKKDEGVWSVPKGEYEDDEEPLAAALREFEEEIGQKSPREGFELTSVRRKDGKVVRAWAIEGDADPAAVQSNEFEMEWPPRTGRKQSFPEIDRADWFTPEEAKKKLYPYQASLVDELLERLGL
ncbi:MAG: hypothetical protein QOE22_50 [Candidatus Parcubacteria bacterium]|jgi:predicted NUDIX family NTP pyrophosphohydrolase|nr:hypothetical protein [Candidatus Parcubacteria bacterium]